MEKSTSKGWYLHLLNQAHPRVGEGGKNKSEIISVSFESYELLLKTIKLRILLNLTHLWGNELIPKDIRALTNEVGNPLSS